MARRASADSDSPFALGPGLRQGREEPTPPSTIVAGEGQGGGPRSSVCGPRAESWGTPTLASVPGDCFLGNLGSRSAGLQPSLLVDHKPPLSLQATEGGESTNTFRRSLRHCSPPGKIRGERWLSPLLWGGRESLGATESRRKGARPGEQEASRQNAASER